MLHHCSRNDIAQRAHDVALHEAKTKDMYDFFTVYAETFDSFVRELCAYQEETE